MTFQVPKAKASIDQNTFKFGFDDDTVYTVPTIQFLKPKHASEITESRNVAAIGRILDDLVPGVYDKFESLEQFNAFLAAWTEASRATLGE
jgi:hypothetical protein